MGKARTHNTYKANKQRRHIKEWKGKQTNLLLHHRLKLLGHAALAASQDAKHLGH
jgi:hypothetical protein